MLPRGRPPSNQGQLTSDYHVGFNQYPQNYSQGVFMGRNAQQYFTNDRQRRDRARPRSQYSYYSDDSSNTNYSANTTLRGGYSNARGLGRGSGIANSGHQKNFSGPKPQGQEQRQNDRGSNAFRKNEIPERNTNSYQNKENRIDNRRLRDSREDMVQPTMYFCPKCGENYNSRSMQNKYTGKLPLILQCSHTMCQECIYHGLKNFKVNCPTCQADSTLTPEQTPVCQADMQNVFLPNFYILGVMSYYKTSGSHLSKLENVYFVTTKQSHSQLSLPEPSERCCFTTCSKEATMYCPSCEGIYCTDCSVVVHKSTKKLMSHEPIPRRKQKFSLMLENCGEHPAMQVEFFCKSCDLTACCYCVLDKHTDHERDALYHLNDIEMEEFKRLKAKAQKVLKEVLSTQKKTARLANFDSGPIKKNMCQYFGDYHGKLEALEKKLCDELENFKASNRGLDTIQASLMASAEQLKQLVAFNEDKIGDKKLNLRGALDKLRNIDNTPRFLLNEDGQAEPMRFVVNGAAIDTLDEDFTLEKCEDSEYRLVTENELPEDYVVDVDESDAEVEKAISAMIKSVHDPDVASLTAKVNDLPKMVSAPAAGSMKSKRTLRYLKEPNKRKIDMERVLVQHINSMDSFFLQYKNDQSKLAQLNKDIEHYVKMGGAQAVEQPQLNDLFLALYINESPSQTHKEQKWCRARLTEIKNGENGPVYEMFFIDYGKTQLVDGNRIRDIPTCLTQKKPFVIECMLYNPMSINWNKKAHYSLAKILNGKDVYMIEKFYNHGIHEVDLMISSSDGGVTSVTDILVHAHNSVEPINDDLASLDGSVCRKDGYYPILRVFPNSKKFTKHQKEKVKIASVVDPYNVFVHPVQHQESFKSMTHAIKKAFKSSKSIKCIPIEGTYVMVEHKDSIRSNWHRAFIKSVDLNSDTVQVLLVDWGVNVAVPSNNIKPLEETFTKLESQAVLVRLAHIAPYNKQATWSHIASNFLTTFYKSQDVLKMVVHETEPELEVALFDIQGNIDMCLNAMMVENNLADSTGPISTRLEWHQFEETNPQFSEDDGLMSSLLKRVDEQTGDDSEDENVSDVKKRQVDVIKVDAPDQIWVKFLDFRERESTMFKELQIHYSEEHNTKTSWKVGEQCVTELGHKYVRGKILAIVNATQYKIYLVDEVQEITSSVNRIYVYDKYFAKYPQAVTKSHLANIQAAGGTGKWSISSVEALQAIFAKHKRIYAAKAQESDSTLTKKSLPLDMWYGSIIHGGALEPDRIKYVSINNSLVKLGYAYKTPKPSTPKAAEKEVSAIKKASNGDDLLKVAKSLVSTLDNEETTETSDVKNSPPDGTISEVVDEAAASKTEVVIENNRDESKNESPKKGAEQPKSDARGAVKKSKKPKKEEVAEEKTAEETKIPQSMEIEENLKILQSMEIEENQKNVVESKQNADKPDEESKEILKKHADHDEDPIQNWNAIVEQELGETADDPEDSPYHKSEVVIDDWLPPFRLTKKDFQARVTCVETGGHLYLHEEAMDDVYYKMEANIKEYFDKNPPEVSDHQWEPGHLCTIKYTDGNWYRGKILKNKSPDEISVFMIDFGSDHDLSPHVLFREVLYTDIGSFATKVKLDKVYAKSGSWLTSDYDQFHDLITDWCRIVVKGPLEVEQPLVDVYNTHGVFVNQKLMELCPNLSRCSNFPIKGVEEEDDAVVIESVESEESYADEMLMENFDRELDCRRAPLRQNYLTENTEIMKYKSLPLPQELLEGKKIEMEIGGVMSIDKVALRIPEEDVNEDLYNLVIELQDAVEDLPNVKSFAIGTPCVAPFSEDGVWYRARITGTTTLDLGLVDVIFVDYGNSESVSIKDVKAIGPDHISLPQQCWEATVNVVLNEETDTMAFMQVMNSIDKKRRQIKLVKENPLTVDIYDQKNNLCYEALLAEGTLKPRLSNDSK